MSWQPTGSGPWVQVPSCWWPMSDREIEFVKSEAVESAMEDTRDYDQEDDRDYDDRDDRDYGA